MRPNMMMVHEARIQTSPATSSFGWFSCTLGIFGGDISVLNAMYLMQPTHILFEISSTFGREINKIQTYEMGE